MVGGRGADAILSSLIPGGTIKPAALQTAAQSSDLAAAATAIAISGHPLAKAMRDGASAYAASSRLLDLEVALDQGYYRHALNVARNTSLRRYLSREIDVTNALIARASKGQPLDPNLFVAGGHLDAGGYARLAGGDAGGLPDIVGILDAPTLEDAEVAARTALDNSARERCCRRSRRRGHHPRFPAPQRNRDRQAASDRTREVLQPECRCSA